MMPLEPLEALLAKLGLAQHVRFFPRFVSEEAYRDHLVGADVAIQLRISRSRQRLRRLGGLRLRRAADGRLSDPVGRDRRPGLRAPRSRQPEPGSGGRSRRKAAGPGRHSRIPPGLRCHTRLRHLRRCPMHRPGLAMTVHLDISQLLIDPRRTGIQRAERELIRHWPGPAPLLPCRHDPATGKLHALPPELLGLLCDDSPVGGVTGRAAPPGTAGAQRCRRPTREAPLRRAVFRRSPRRLLRQAGRHPGHLLAGLRLSALAPSGLVQPRSAGPADAVPASASRHPFRGLHQCRHEARLRRAHRSPGRGRSGDSNGVATV